MNNRLLQRPSMARSAACFVAAVGCGMTAAPGADAPLDPRHYGARPDGTRSCTRAIQQAIDDCAARGGGVVRLSGGTFLSGTLVLKSGVTLELAEGATLLGSTRREEYPVLPSPVASYTDRYTHSSLIYAAGAERVGIRGRGVIDGQGAAFAGEYKQRPYALRFVACTNVLVEGVTLRNSAMWMQHYLECERLTLRNLTVWNHANKNNDLLDVDGCRQVLVTGCTGDSDDDGITLKSTSDRPCEDVTISNCVVSSHCNAIKCGTESHGGFRRIRIRDCTVRPSRDREPIYGRPDGLAGVALEIVDGGTMENVWVERIQITGTTAPIFVRLGDRGRTFRPDQPRPGVGALRRVTLRDITATNAGPTGCAIAGLSGHPIEDLTLSRLRFVFQGGGKVVGVPASERRESYPECTMFGPLPAYGLFCWHVKGLRLEHVELQTLTPDARPPLVLEDVRDVVRVP